MEDTAHEMAHTENDEECSLTNSTAGVDIRVRVRGGGHTSQVYAIRQAIAKSVVRLQHYLPRSHPAHEPY